MLTSLACGSKPITVGRAERQFKQDQRFMETVRYINRAESHKAFRRQKFFDQVHPNFRAEMFDLSVICRQAYLDIVGGALLYKLKAFRFVEPMVMGYFCFRTEMKWRFIQTMFLDFDVLSETTLKMIVILLENLPEHINLKKLRLRMKIGRELNRENDPLHLQNIQDVLANSKGLWRWTMGIEKTDKHRLKDFFVDIRGIEGWPFYFRFGGDKSGWHLVRNTNAVMNVNVGNVLFRLKERYPSRSLNSEDCRQGKFLSEDTSPTDVDYYWYDFNEPIWDIDSALRDLERDEDEAQD